MLPETSKRLREKMHQLMDEGKISRQSRVMFVNDGSSDNTWPIISQLHEQEPEMFSGVNLSRNRGHQNALLAGLLTAVNYADMIVSMDADLQDDINAVDEMVDGHGKRSEDAGHADSSARAVRCAESGREKAGPCADGGRIRPARRKHEQKQHDRLGAFRRRTG